jgi:hypothetical protein
MCWALLQLLRHVERHSGCILKRPSLLFFCFVLYRVSIRSFPDYKHLLQENYMEYKHIFFTIKLVSKMLCHVFIVMLQKLCLYST